jgi:cytidylate kinase
MAVITISKQYGSGGNEIAARVCETLGYRYFDKRLMAQVASETGLSESGIVDFSEDDYKVRNFLDLLFGASTPRTVAQVRSWKEDTTGVMVPEVKPLDENQAISLVQSIIKASYKQGNVVIVGRGGQAVLKDRLDALHVRIQASLETRRWRIHQQEGIDLEFAHDVVIERDQAAADYLKRFYGIDWADSTLYDLVLNTGKLSLEAAAHLIVNAVRCLPSAQSS